MNIELDFKLIGERIQKLRTEKNMTQSELAEKIDTNQKHLSCIEGDIIGQHLMQLLQSQELWMYLLIIL